MEKELRRVGRLEDAWNRNLTIKFYKCIKSLFKPSTVLNYHSALTVLRDYLQLQGLRPKNYLDLKEEFRLAMRKALKDKNEYVKVVKHSRKDSRQMLSDFYRKILHNSTLWERYEKLVKIVRDATQIGANIQRLSCGDFHFCTSFMLCLPIAYNLKRTGNHSQIKLKAAKSALNDALAAYQRANPKAKIASLPRRMDVTTFVPALFSVTASKKKSDIETFCILHPKHILALLNYAEYIRNYAPSEPLADTFFINSRGRPLGDHVTYFVDRIGRAAKIEGLKISTLRSLIETENYLTQSNAAAKVNNTRFVLKMLLLCL